MESVSVKFIIQVTKLQRIMQSSNRLEVGFLGKNVDFDCTKCAFVPEKCPYNSFLECFVEKHAMTGGSLPQKTLTL